MAGERLDYSIERQRHESFVGRAALLSRLDQLLVTDRRDCWVLVTGGPGMGKSAMLAAWLARREAAGATVPHHFIRRGEYNWDDPATLVDSLLAQIEQRFPDLCESTVDAQNHPAARLAAALTRVSMHELVPNRERLVLLIDGLDEYDPPARLEAADPLAAFLPHALPRGVSFLCASRPRHPYVAMLEARDGELIRLGLDEPGGIADNDATVRAFWDREAPPLALDAGFIDEAVARAGGNLQHAVTLRKHLAGLPPAQRRVEGIPRGLGAMLAKSWQRIAIEPLAVRGLGILCAAREALTLDELAAAAGWTEEAQRQAFLRGASEFLIETVHANRQPEYRLHHETIGAHIASTLGAAALRTCHVALARQLATWPAPQDPTMRRYALRHALVHRVHAGDWPAVLRLAADTGFWEAKCRELGVHEAEIDAARTADLGRTSGEAVFARRLDDLVRALVRESHRLREAPEATAALLWNRLRRLGWDADQIDEQLIMPGVAPFLRVRYATTRESWALVRDLVGHAQLVTACAVTPDGRRMVSASGDRTLKVWELASGRVLSTFEGHLGGVTACAVAPDGRRVVSASGDHTLRVWDLDTGRVLATCIGHTERVTACAVTPDGRQVASASADRTLAIWDLGSGSVVTTFEGHTDRVTACVVTPDGRRLISASWDQTLKIWDLDRRQAVITLLGHTDQVTACAVTPDGRRVISASKDKTLRLWDLDGGHLLATFEGHLDRVTACAVTSDGRRVVSASNDQTLKVWDLGSGRLLSTYEGHAWWVTACAVTPDGRRVVSGSWDQTLKIWDLDGDGVLAPFEGHSEEVTACAVTSDGASVVSASRDGTLKVWSIDSGRVLATFEGHAGGVTACTVTPDGRRAISASEDETFKVWDMNDGRIVATYERHASGVTACAVTPDGRRMVSASGARMLKVWDLEDGRLLSTFDGNTEGCTACAVTPDGQRVVWATRHQTFKIWDMGSGHLTSSFGGHAGRVTACAVTPDNRRLVSASEDRTLKIWELARGTLLAVLEGHAGRVTACAVTPDGRHVISASVDRTLRVWDLASCACVFLHRGDVAYTAVVATATTIIAGDNAGTVWMLDWPRSAPRVVQPRLPHPAASRHVILFLAANPRGTTRLDLDDECAAIERELSMTPARHDFDFYSKWAVGVDEMMRHLNELQPTVIHFSGHGGSDADLAGRDFPHRTRERDVADPAGAGIYLEDEHHQRQHVSARALTQMISSASSSARVVVLNACYSDALADALCSVVDCIVGMHGAIEDRAARSFAVGFYRALGNRCSVGNAVAQARATLAAKHVLDEHLPMCRTRSGLSADQLVLPSVNLRGT
jgi:WD40 repeat protein